MLETCDSLSPHVPSYQHATPLQCTHAIAEGKLFHLHEIKHVYVYFITEVYTCMTLQNCTAEDALPPGLPVNPDSESLRVSKCYLIQTYTLFNQDFFFSTLLSNEHCELLCGHSSQSAEASLEWTSILFNWQDKSVRDAELIIRNSDLYTML